MREPIQYRPLLSRHQEALMRKELKRLAAGHDFSTVARPDNHIEKAGLPDVQVNAITARDSVGAICLRRDPSDLSQR